MGALSVTWVLDERGVVVDNILDWVSPVEWERDRSVYEGRPARMLAGTPVAGAERETLMCVVGGPGSRCRL